MMSHIYSRASEVLIWLGPISSVEAGALARFSTWCRGIRQTHGFRLRSAAREKFGEVLRLEYKYEALSDSCRRGMVRLLQNPY